MDVFFFPVAQNAIFTIMVPKYSPEINLRKHTNVKMNGPYKKDKKNQYSRFVKALFVTSFPLIVVSERVLTTCSKPL